MKPIQLIIIFLSLLIPTLGYSQKETKVIDDIYYSPNDKTPTYSSKNEQKPTYKNGAKEIIFREHSDSIKENSTLSMTKEENDSLLNDTIHEEGCYLHGFKGSSSDYEYAERIRRFHNPKFTIHISDPDYMDLYFLDDYNWNVYIEGGYAWVTPTWTNPLWFDYYYRPFMYNSWYWRWSLYYPSYSYWYSPWYYYPWHAWYYDPWYYSPWYYGYYRHPYYGGYYHYKTINPSHNEANRRQITNFGNERRVASSSSSAMSTNSDNVSQRNGRSNNPYTVITGTGARSSNTTRMTTPSNAGNSSSEQTRRGAVLIIKINLKEHIILLILVLRQVLMRIVKIPEDQLL